MRPERSAATPAGSRQRSGAHYLLTAAAFVVVVAGIRAASAIVVPILLAVFIAAISMPAMQWLQRRRVPAGLAIAIILAALSLLAIGALLLVGKSVQDTTANLPTYQKRLGELEDDLLNQLEGLGIPLSKEQVRGLVDPKWLTGLFRELLNGVIRLFGDAVVILISVGFMLAEASWFARKVRAAFDDGSSHSVDRAHQIVVNVRRYILIKTGVSVLTGVFIGVLLSIAKVENAVLWGFLAFLFNYVPNIGPIIPAVPATMLALIQSGIGLACWTAFAFLLVNQVLGNVIEPRLQGQGLGLSTLVVFLSLLFWGWVLGPIGMLLSAPLTMAVKIALESYPDLRWVAVMLGSKVPAEASEGPRRRSKKHPGWESK